MAGPELTVACSPGANTGTHQNRANSTARDAYIAEHDYACIQIISRCLTVFRTIRPNASLLHQSRACLRDGCGDLSMLSDPKTRIRHIRPDDRALLGAILAVSLVPACPDRACALTARTMRSFPPLTRQDSSLQVPYITLCILVHAVASFPPADLEASIPANVRHPPPHQSDVACSRHRARHGRQCAQPRVADQTPSAAL